MQHLIQRSKKQNRQRGMVLVATMLVLMGLLWGAFVLLVAHGSTWLGRWWDNNVGTPGTPSWRRK